MSYKSISIDNLLLCQWEKMEEEDCHRLAKEIEQQYLACKEMLIIISMLKQNTSVPSPGFSILSLEMMANNKNYFKKMITVLPDTGIKSTILRNTANTIMLASSERKKLMLADTLDNALEFSKEWLLRNKTEILDIAVAKHFFEESQ